MGKAFTIMKRSAFIGLVFCLAFFWLSPGSKAYLKGDIDGDDKISLVEAVHALQVVSGQREALASKTINVPAQFDTIQGAIDAAVEGDTINIAAATYTENLLIKKNYITLQGAGQDATIIQGGTLDAITVEGANGVNLQGFKIQGGTYGVYGRMGARFLISDLTVEDTARNGIRVAANSVAVIQDCSVYRSGEDGIKFYMNSGGVLRGAIISSNNTWSGIDVMQTSSLILTGASVTVNANSGQGIRVRESSSLVSQDSQLTAQGNKNDGVAVWNGSSLNLISAENWLIENGGSRGMLLRGASHCDIRPASSLVIDNNKDIGMYITSSSVFHSDGNVTVKNTTGGEGTGISVIQSSVLDLGWGTVLVENNRGSVGDGIRVGLNSNITIIGGDNPIAIKGNGRFGLGIGGNSDGLITGSSISIEENEIYGLQVDGATVQVVNTTITGNTSADVALFFGAKASLNGNTIGSITCTEDVLSRGTHTCP